MTTVMNQPTLSRAHACPARGLFDGRIMRQALKDSLTKLDPRLQVKNPVMFVVLVGSVISLLRGVLRHPSTFTWSITIWLFLKVSSPISRGHGRGSGQGPGGDLAQNASETERVACDRTGTEELVPAASLLQGLTWWFAR